MKTYLSDLIPKIKRFSQKLDNITLLTNQHWVVIDELKNSKYVYIFRSNSELLISQDGKVEKGKWEYLGNNALLIERKDDSYLFKHGFFDENILALKVDGKEEYAFLVNETDYSGELNTLEGVVSFLENKYLTLPMLGLGKNDTLKKTIEQVEEKFGYTIKWEKQHFDIIWGHYAEYSLQFYNQMTGFVYRGKSSGKYFYCLLGQTYCQNFEEAASNLYQEMIKLNITKKEKK